MRSSSALADHIRYRVFEPQSISPFAKHVLIYYVTGNPGFIEYYRNLFNALVDTLTKSSDASHVKHKTQYYIRGSSLSGFEVKDQRPARVLSLDEIKRDLIDSIITEAEHVAGQSDIEPSDVSVVLVGHSIGTWLILEAIVDLQRLYPESRTIAGGILLFPTVFDLAKSPNGVRGGWLLSSRYTPFLISLIAQLLFGLIPLTILTLLLRIFLRMPKHHALVTATMLKTRRLVEQALYMAHGELQQVKDDQWSDELWGVQKTEAKQLARKSLVASADPGLRPSLFFYWGENDHWVANATRDAVIAKRAQTSAAGDELKPVMEIDTHGLPHAFTLTDGGAEIVADKIIEWVHDIEHRC